MRKFLINIWPFLILLAIELVLFLCNYTPKTWLMGWDTLMPELAPKVNFVRSFFGTWQEHRGLGYADGMSHIAELLHVLVIWVLTYILPLPLVRYAFVFGTHLLGGMGIFCLLTRIFPKHQVIPTFIGTLYYLFNAATIQIYAVPFESFVIQYAALPWLLYGLWKYLEEKTNKSYLLFVLMCILASAQYFVPTLFAGTTLLFLSVLVTKGISLKHEKTGRLLFKAFLTYLICNLYWLLPYLVMLPYNAPVIKNAKFNIMASDNTMANNQARGSLFNVVTLRGYMLDADMPDPKTGLFDYFFTPIRIHLDDPLGITAAILFPLLSFLTVGYIAYKRKHTPLWPIIGFGIAAGGYILILGSGIMGIGSIQEIIRTSFPIVSEAFRDPFTKFRLPLMLSFTVLGTTCLYLVSHLSSKRHFSLIAGITAMAIGYLSFPYWGGYFIHPFMRVNLPSQYEQFFQFMREQPHGRIATFPQPTFWSWRTTNYGYTGSGFLWYGLKQPTMDRSFDPWSRENENYYWEITYALYKKDPIVFEKVLQKYDISYILIDQAHRSIFNQPKSLYYQELIEMMRQIPNAQLLKTFDTLMIFSVGYIKERLIDIKESLPKIDPAYQYGDNDVAYQLFGDYITGSSDMDVYFPFRPLSSKQNQKYTEITFGETSQNLSISAQIDELTNTRTLFSAPQDPSVQITGDTVTAYIEKTKSIRFQAVGGENLTTKDSFPCNINMQGKASVADLRELSEAWVRFSGNKGNACMRKQINSLETSKGYLVAIVHRNVQGKPLLVSLANDTARHTEIDAVLTKDTQWHTDYLIVPTLAKDGLGYSLYFTNEAKGNNDTINDIKEIKIYEFPYEKLINFYFQKSGSSVPSEYSNGLRNQLSVYHDNSSYYRVNLNNSLVSGNTSVLTLSQAYHPGWKAYTIHTNNPILQLSNSPIKNLLLGTMPFIFGTELREHVLVNNWANGWILDPKSATNGTTIVLFFWPQLLQWLGFLLLPIPFLLLFASKHHKEAARSA